MITLETQHYLDLWKHYSEDSAKVKDKLWTIASWLYALMSGLMGFLIKEGENKPMLVLLGAIMGIVLSGYTCYMIQMYGKHIIAAWKATRYLRHKIEGMAAVWDSTGIQDESDEPLPRFARPLLWLAIGYGLAFIGILIYFNFK